MRRVRGFTTANEALMEAARVARRAAKACRDWENGGPSGPVGDTAEVAISAIDPVLRNICEEDGVVLSGKNPEVRRARLVLAGYTLLLAGTDEHGESADLTLAASIFRRAAVT
ncbi:MAG: hypothetical protein V4530_09455 [Pseudomonadota bacterium]